MTAYTPAPLANLYPEVDPHQAIPLSATERFALTVSCLLYTSDAADE